MFKLPIVLTFIFILSYVLLCKIFAKREGYYSTIMIFGLGCYVYYVGVPFELAICDLDFFQHNQVELQLSNAQLSLIIAMGTAALLSFSAGYYISKFEPRKLREHVLTYHTNRSIPFSIWFLLLACTAIVAVVFNNEVVAVGTYSGSYATTYNNPAFQLLCSTAYICIAMIASVLMCRQKDRHKLIGAALIAMIFLWGIYSSDKNPIVIGILAVGTYYIQRSRSIWFLLAVVFGAVTIIFSFAIFSIYRGGGDLDLLYIAAEFFGLRYTDPTGPLYSLQEAIENNQTLRYGATYLESLALFIPKFLWRDRPMDLSELFALEHMTRWSEGKGMGYSLMAEAYLNFRWLGSILQYFAIGLLWGYMWRAIQRLVWHYGEYCWYAIYYIVGFNLLILMHRAPFSGLLKSTLHYLIVIVFFAIIFDHSMLPIIPAKQQEESI